MVYDINGVNSERTLFKMTALVGIAILGTALVYWTAWIYYQLWSSPLAKFPGPKLAAVSRYYELYYDGFKTHGYARKIRVLHKLYGDDDV